MDHGHHNKGNKEKITQQASWKDNIGKKQQQRLIQAYYVQNSSQRRDLDRFRFRKDIGKIGFTNTVVEWNKLSKHVVSAGTVDTFKKVGHFNEENR